MSVRTTPSSTTALEEGQIWHMAGSRLRIRQVGRTLVHYSHFRGESRRSPILLANIATVQHFLKTNKATLAES